MTCLCLTPVTRARHVFCFFYSFYFIDLRGHRFLLSATHKRSGEGDGTIERGRRHHFHVVVVPPPSAISYPHAPSLHLLGHGPRMRTRKSRRLSTDRTDRLPLGFVVAGRPGRRFSRLLLYGCFDGVDGAGAASYVRPLRWGGLCRCHR